MTAIYRSKNSVRTRTVAFCIGLACMVTTVAATAAAQSAAEPRSAVVVPTAVPTPFVPPGYVIGASDVLSVRFWRQADISADVVVRPDGKISLLLLNDIEAAGLTPEQLRERIIAAADQFFEEPQVTV